MGPVINIKGLIWQAKGTKRILIFCCAEFAWLCEADAVEVLIRRNLGNTGMTFTVLFFPGKFD
ncbi:MAG: hypothetical protein CXR30_06905 [Geobacter sp.]|nr:MAG: hypothetical protein CXR30_06905 [Geobacter sp.]